ncbi:hypothetical protein OAF83_00910 [Rubripirellula sp.]|nr:hypothetical protein [Rubripirellula sp.]
MRNIRFESEPLDICWTGDTVMVASCVDSQVRVFDTENVEVRQTIPVLKGWAYAVPTHSRTGTIALAWSNGQTRRVQIEK